MRALPGALHRLRAWAERNRANACFVLFAIAVIWLFLAHATASLVRPDSVAACQERLVAAALSSGLPGYPAVGLILRNGQWEASESLLSEGIRRRCERWYGARTLFDRGRAPVDSCG